MKTAMLTYCIKFFRQDSLVGPQTMFGVVQLVESAPAHGPCCRILLTQTPVADTPHRAVVTLLTASGAHQEVIPDLNLMNKRLGWFQKEFVPGQIAKLAPDYRYLDVTDSPGWRLPENSPGTRLVDSGHFNDVGDGHTLTGFCLTFNPPVPQEHSADADLVWLWFDHLTGSSPHCVRVIDLDSEDLWERESDDPAVAPDHDADASALQKLTVQARAFAGRPHLRIVDCRDAATAHVRRYASQ